MDLRKATAAAIGRGLQAGALDAVDVSEFFLERIVARPLRRIAHGKKHEPLHRASNKAIVEVL
jgi:hypothetical protein